MGSSTVNSPASLVFGSRAKLSLPPFTLNGEKETSHNGNVYQNVYALPNGQYAPRVDPPTKSTGFLRVHSPSPSPQSPNKPLSPPYFKVPSPAFDRNPSYQFRRTVTSPTQSMSSSVEDLTANKGQAEIRRRQVRKYSTVFKECLFVC